MGRQNATTTCVSCVSLSDKYSSVIEKTHLFVFLTKHDQWFVQYRHAILNHRTQVRDFLTHDNNPSQIMAYLSKMIEYYIYTLNNPLIVNDMNGHHVCFEHLHSIISNMVDIQLLSTSLTPPIFFRLCPSNNWHYYNFSPSLITFLPKKL
ncbi:hypothetical protein K7432_017647 [Basidiobolus ranarum]|uniref:Uncharacterized protein n=1 Tax=Basidiobolus ranarum TaxID=34480 RepID=A0ABR2VKD8_9FUNG